MLDRMIQADIDQLIPNVTALIQSDPDQWHTVYGRYKVAAAAKLEEMGIAEMMNTTRFTGCHSGMVHLIGKTK